MNCFDFVLPTKIRFGNGIVSEISNEIDDLVGLPKTFIVTDKGLKKAGVLDRVLKQMSASVLDNMVIFDDVEPNPRDTTVHKAYQLAKENGSNLIVAIGGGSAMDTAKGVAVLLGNGGKIADFEGLDMVKNDTPPLIAIPTTVGTGSEVTFWSVITDTKRHFKMSIGTTKIAPKVALIDPDLVETLPPGIIASTGMDAMTHAIEGYTCRLSEPITDACGIYAIELLSSNIRSAVYTDDKVAKANMLLGSLIAGICFGNSDIASVHAMAEALGGLYDTPHGIANAVILPYVMEYNYVVDIKKFSRIAQSMGENISLDSERDAAFKSVLAVKKLNQDLNIPTLREIGVKEKDLCDLAKRSAMNVSSESNAKAIAEEDYLSLFKKAFAN